MAISSSTNRSPSPIPSSRTNPNSRTPENSSGTRKSFSGGNPFSKPSIVPNNRRCFNPITPANSPAEFSQRNCRDGLSSLRVSYDKENHEKDQNQNQKPARVRSPAVPSPGTKNFMAPTISAASKIAPSPRKKILAERNETTTVRVSSDSMLVEEIGSKTELVFDTKVVSSETPITVEALSMAPLISEASNVIITTPKNNLSFVSVSDEKPFRNSKNRLDFSTVEAKPGVDSNSEVPLTTTHASSEPRILSSSMIKSPSLCSPLAPLDADPSVVPPYDPKTNYLSPRPLFLHYKPNPRIEGYLNKEDEFNLGEGKRLEDSFTSESSSDTENTEVTQDSDSRKESEDVTSSEVVSEVEEEIHVHRNNDIVRVKKISTSSTSFAARPKTIPLLLVLVVACLSFTVTDTPLHTPSVYEDPSFSKFESPAYTVDLSRMNIDDFASNLKLWLLKSTSYFSKFKPIPRVVEELDPYYSINLTALDQSLDQAMLAYDFQTLERHRLEIEEEGEMEEGLRDEKVEGEFAENNGNIDMEDEAALTSEAIGSELQIWADIDHTSAQIEEETEEATAEEHGYLEVEDQSSIVPQPLEFEQAILEDQTVQQIDTVERNEGAVSEEYDGREIEEHSSLIPEAPEIEHVTSEAMELEDNSIVEPINAEVTPSQSLELEDAPTQSSVSSLSAIHNSEDTFAQAVYGISSVLLILVASTAFLYLKGKRASPGAAVEAPAVVKQLPSKKLLSSSSISAGLESQHTLSVPADSHPYLERVSSHQNWGTHVETTGQSGPSDSYQNSSSCNPRGSERVSEVQSQERKPRRNSNRESLTPSEYSSGLSPSYGSFTTYEKIPSKYGYGDDEVVTPVRRSSRLKKQVTSP